MLERYFTSAYALRLMRAKPAAPLLEEFAAALSAADFRPRVITQRVRDAAHLCEWAAAHGLALADLGDRELARFRRHLGACRCPGNGSRGYDSCCRIRAFLEHLRRTGVLGAPTNTSRSPRLVEQYGGWLREQRGATEATAILHGRLIRAFVQAAGDDPGRYDARKVREFVLSRARDHERHSGGSVTTTMRSFLRYLVTAGRCSADLVGAVPRMPSWRLGKLPPYLAPEAIDRIINTCASRTPRKIRDRAILLLLARLGLRASDIVNLRLDDVDWAVGKVRVLGKGRREAWLPLPQEVGDALLAYLTRARRGARDDHVFLTARAPRTPLAATSVSARVRVAMAAAGIEAPSRGAHILRHSLASRMLRAGATMEAIGTVLRHRGMATTALYAKVDVTLLRHIALPWPGLEVSPC